MPSSVVTCGYLPYHCVLVDLWATTDVQCWTNGSSAGWCLARTPIPSAFLAPNWLPKVTRAPGCHSKLDHCLPGSCQKARLLFQCLRDVRSHCRCHADRSSNPTLGTKLQSHQSLWTKGFEKEQLWTEGVMKNTILNLDHQRRPTLQTWTENNNQQQRSTCKQTTWTIINNHH